MERVGFFWDGLNVQTFNCRHRADRRVEGLVAEGWVDGGMGGWVGGGMGGLQKLTNVFLRLGGFAKVDNRFELILSVQGGYIGWFHLCKRYV